MKNRRVNATVITNKTTMVDAYGHVSYMDGNIYSAARNDEDFSEIAKFKQVITETEERRAN